MAASELLVLLTWSVLVSAARAATRAEVSALKDLATKINLQPGTWNFSQDPCAGQWFGICCCVRNSSDCQVEGYNPQKTCSNRTTARVVGVFLDVNYKPSIPPLNGTISDSVCNLTSLVLLVFSNNPIRGPIPACIGTKLRYLRSFQSVGGYLNGSIPQELGSLRRLTRLWLGYNMLSGSIPASLGSLRRLGEIALNGNQLTGALPPELGRLTNLTMFRLGTNMLSGSIPSTLSSLTNLQDFWLHGNKLSGEVNVSVFRNMPGLKTLFLHKNNFTGPVPALEVQSLEKVNLGFNSFNGTIPESLGKLPFLKELYLGHNNLSGSLPSSFGSLPQIEVLDISHNRLTGFLDNLPKNKAVDFSFNNFDTQRLPVGLVSEDIGQSFFNCINCPLSYTGKTTSSAMVAGQKSLTMGGTLFQQDAVSNRTGLFYFGERQSWAVAVSGSLTNTYTAPDSTAIQGLSQGELPQLYRSMRWSMSYLAYHCRNLEKGEYTVTMYFAETTLPMTTLRVFDVVVQGVMVKEKLDVMKEVGSFAAYKIQRNVSVLNGLLSIEFIGNGGDRYLDPKNYPYVQKQGPMVSAISVKSLGYKESTRWKRITLAVVVPVGFILVMIVSVVAFWWCKTKGLSRNTNKKARLPKGYTYQELFKATEGFSEKAMLGQGAFGRVYLGTLGGKLVAVKQLVRMDDHAKVSFMRELELLSMVQHKNLLAIIGYCKDPGNEMIVCDYMPNGSLDQHRGNLSWEQRQSIAVETALGLAYLHDHHIVHCDIKPHNILLDKDFNPRIGDFGMARLHEADRSHITASRAGGTVGYMAPDSVRQGRCLQLWSGRRVIEIEFSEAELFLVEWAASMEAELEKIMDERVSNSTEEAVKMALVGLHCTLEDARRRPNMRTVWLMLTGTADVPALPSDSARGDNLKFHMRMYLDGGDVDSD